MNLQMRFLFSLAITFCGLTAKAQQPDSLRILADSIPTISADTGSVVKKDGAIRRFFTKDYPKPRRAALLSFILPGAGQIYNKRWWKLPIVYGALGGIVWLEVDNVKQYRELRDNYKLLVDEDPNTNPTEPPYNQIDATSMKSYRDQWRRYVEQTSLFLGLAYLLQVTDAFVDAHLRSFDVSDDLSLRFQPKMDAVPGFGATFGLGASLQFGTARSKTFSPKQFSFSPP